MVLLLHLGQLHRACLERMGHVSGSFLSTQALCLSDQVSQQEVVRGGSVRTASVRCAVAVESK